MRICACMGPQINPLTGQKFPKCPCDMEGKYTQEEVDALVAEAKEATIRLNKVLKEYVLNDQL